LPVIDFSSSPAVGGFVEEVNRLAARVDALALVSPDHPALAAVVARLEDEGKPVFSLLSDFAVGRRTGFVGTDNRKVGRTAAWMIARCAPKPGKVALLVGSHGFHGHELREMGLRSFFREHAPGFTVLETAVTYESVDLTRQAMFDFLRRDPDLVGAYVAGGGGEGAIEALRAAAPRPMPVLICNEDLAQVRQALTDGTLTMSIATPLPLLSRHLVARMLAALGGGEGNPGGDAPLPFRIMLPESF
jgi:LacI family transcriptional regulator